MEGDSISLIVIRPFAEFQRGAVITDPDRIKAVLATQVEALCTVVIRESPAGDGGAVVIVDRKTGELCQ